MEDKLTHINSAIGFANLVRSTLGPKGMNKMVVDPNGKIILTNDGATILSALDSKSNPMWQLIKELSKSQEQAIGDGTTTTTVLLANLLTNAVTLMNKGIHPTTIITGYSLASVESRNFLLSKKEDLPLENIIRTAFGTKISPDLIDKLTSLLLNIKDIENLKIHVIPNSDPNKSEIFKGYVFNGFTLNDRMKIETDGKIAVLDFPVHLKADRFSVTNAEELEKVSNFDTNYKRRIVDKLVEMGVNCVFYTDTTPEFESYLTENGISGIVVFQREHVDGICKATHSIAASNVDQIDEKHIGTGKMKHKKGEGTGTIYLSNPNYEAETLVIHGQTEQIVDEVMRALDDVIRLMRHDCSAVVGAGAIEIELALHLRDYAQVIGGKEQLAIESFAEALESIPMIISENAGLDAIEIVTVLKTLHTQGHKDFGVDIINRVSDARKRNIFEPVLIKLQAIGSATNLANLILKLDGILSGGK